MSLPSFTDDNGHGSHVAGTIAARDNGGNVLVDGVPTAVAGVAPGARLWAVEVLNSNGSGSMSCVIKGVEWVTANAATIEQRSTAPGHGGLVEGQVARLVRAAPGEVRPLMSDDVSTAIAVTQPSVGGRAAHARQVCRLRERCGSRQQPSAD